MIELCGVTMQHGSQVLFLDASFKLNPGEKAGLVGPNGSGKTTIFRLLLGEERPDEGTVERPRRLTIGYFRQDFADYGNKSVLAETMAGAGPLAALGDELAALEARLGSVDDPDYDRVIERYGEVQAQFQEGGGYDLEARARALLAGLGFGQAEVEGTIGALSGGWRMRVQLARLLL
ncbi:MAG: ABC-F family ATP-binding cassette domain-containing protein, partial [Deltaproteobacteria bacterium]|nr:ABC-F family ATP-binding cassette domain-containing protein [Deltaproteobacteria bacterium]